MNLALSALLIILFLLPAYSFRIGISFLSRRNTGQPSVQETIRRNISRVLSKLNFTETVFLFSFIPLLLHLSSLFLLHALGCRIDYDLVLNIFSGKPGVLENSSNEIFHYKLLWFLLYTLLETTIACTAGLWLVHWVGDKNWLLQMLTGDNIWYKLFAGASLSTVQKRQLSNVLVEMLVETKETSLVYSGLLKNYETTEDGNSLAYVTLTGAYRRDLRKAQVVVEQAGTLPSATATRYDTEYGDIVPIPGQIFTLPGNEIVNINVTYMKQETDGQTGQKKLVPVSFEVD